MVFFVFLSLFIGNEGKYPQIFLIIEGSVKYLGDYKSLQHLVENDHLDVSFLNQHPEIHTFSSEFAKIPRKI